MRMITLQLLLGYSAEMISQSTIRKRFSISFLIVLAPKVAVDRRRFKDRTLTTALLVFEQDILDIICDFTSGS